MVDQSESLALPPEDRLQYEHCFTISDAKPRTAHTSSAVPDKGHFVLLHLKSPDSNHTIQVPFQIDSAASCNTLPSKHLSNIAWATVIATRTVILPYASPPIKPIGQITIEASKGSTTCNLTFQVIDTDQPALLSAEASKTLGVLTLNADFIRKCATTDPPTHPTADPPSGQDLAAGPPSIPSRYFKANMAPARNYHHGVHLEELYHIISRTWLPWAPCGFRSGPQCQAHPRPSSSPAHLETGVNKSGIRHL